jgi:hypothetical protein
VVAEDGMELLPDRIVLAPGDAHLTSTVAGRAVVRLTASAPSSSGCLPSVDPMLASVGRAFGRGALGVVLTGMGRDGVEGAARLVACGGSVLAQDEASCAVWGMPRAVARGGLACAVLPPDKIARRIASRRGARRASKRQLEPNPRRPARGAHRPAADDEPPLADRDRACRAAARARHRHARRADHHPRHGQGAEPVAAGGRGLAQQRNLFLPRPRAVRPARSARAARARQAPPQVEALRIWSAGCSTGQEAYSLAMLFAEDPERWRGWTIDILGTDVSTRASIARAPAVYSQFEVQRGLGINQMIRWFEECADGWRAVEALRKPVRFQVHNCSSRRRIRASSTSSCAATCCSTSARKARAGVRPAGVGDGRGRLADARRRRDGDRPDRASSAPTQCARPLPPGRRRQQASKARAAPTA